MADESVRLPTTAVAPEVLGAIEALSRSTGLSKTFLIRQMLTTALADLGLLSRDEVQPTRRRK